jgi:hypothetical protein
LATVALLLVASVRRLAIRGLLLMKVLIPLVLLGIGRVATIWVVALVVLALRRGTVALLLMRIMRRVVRALSLLGIWAMRLAVLLMRGRSLLRVVLIVAVVLLSLLRAIISMGLLALATVVVVTRHLEV